jgi:L-ascorbate metabolism protein UlaG (beta-lactamase superfamily)
VLPIHWGTFPILAGTPAELRDAIAARGGSAEVVDWRPGDTVG